jgi:hypothetical protein
MAWSGGSFTKANAATGGWVGDASLGIGIEAGRHDNQDNDFATGINQCLNKDGSNAATGNLNLGGFLPTNIGAGTAAAPAICAGNDVNTGIFAPASDQIGIATNGSERVRIDSTGKVGIGTTAPYSSLDVLDSFQLGASATATNNFHITANSSGGFAGNLIIWNGNNGAGTERMRIDSSGRVGIGVPSSSDTRLLINGTGSSNATFSLTARNSSSANLLYCRDDGLINTGTLAASPYNNILGVAANMYVGTDGSLYRATSSIKYKTDVENYDKGLNEVLSLRPVYYKDKHNPSTQYAGLIAEEVLEAGMPEFIQYAADHTPDGLSYGHMLALAVNAIKELNAKIEALEARVAELEA